MENRCKNTIINACCFMDSFTVVIILCGVALLAILLNFFKKLPKFVFVFFAVSIVFSVSWYAMGSGEKKHTDSFLKSKAPITDSLVFMEVAQNLAISSGETRFSVPVFLTGKRRSDCVRMVIESDNDSLTEQSFIKNVHFSLLSADGTGIPATWIQISKNEQRSFPKSFVLKIFFDLPETLNTSDFRCVVENNSETAFRVPEISVGAIPFSEANKEN